MNDRARQSVVWLLACFAVRSICLTGAVALWQGSAECQPQAASRPKDTVVDRQSAPNDADLERIIEDGSQPSGRRREAARLLARRANRESLSSLYSAHKQVLDGLAGIERFEFPSSQKAKELRELRRAILVAIMSIKLSETATWPERLRALDGIVAQASHGAGRGEAAGDVYAAIYFIEEIEITDENEKAVTAQLHSANERMREAIIKCMARSRRNGVRQALEDYLTGEPGGPPVPVIQALGAIGSGESVPTLRRIAFDATLNGRTRAAAMAALQEIRKVSPDVLETIRSSEDPLLVAHAFGLSGELRKMAASAIEGLGRSRLEEALREEDTQDGITVLHGALEHLDAVDSFFAAARRGDMATVRRALVTGESPFRTDTWGNTALHMAAENGHDELVRLLGQIGSIDVRNMRGWTPVMSAAKAGRKEVVFLLLEMGADMAGLIPDGFDVNRRGPDGQTPLYSVVEGNMFRMVEFLIAKGARVDVRDNRGRTPLHVAACAPRTDSRWSNAQQIVGLLVTNGAKVNARDNAGNTPLDLATSEKMRELLRRHGAKPGSEVK